MVKTCTSSEYSSCSTIDALQETRGHRYKKHCDSTIDVLHEGHCDNSTIDALQEICGMCDKNTPCNSRYDSGVSCFSSVITPVTGLDPQHTNHNGTVEFRMRRKNKTVTLQWEPFMGAVSQTGVSFLSVCQSICNTPPYPVSFPISIQYKGINKFSFITIDPNSKTGNIKFYLNQDKTSTDITVNDSFYIYGGAVTWIVD